MSLRNEYSLNFGGRELGFNIDHVAKQANGSVMVRYGDTVILCTVVVGKQSKEEKSYFPLMVDYVEKFYSVGKIPGGFLKREGRPSEREILTARVIDRSLRPLFPAGFKREVHIVCNLLSYDSKGGYESAALIGASLACSLSGLPMKQIVAGCNVGYVDGEFVINPASGIDNNLLDMSLSASKSSIVMIESEANELEESQMLDAIKFGHKSLVPVVELMKEISSKHRKSEIEFIAPDYSDLENEIKKNHLKDFEEAQKITNKQERGIAVDKIKSSIKEKFEEDYSSIVIEDICDELQKNLIRKSIVSKKVRIDGRKFEDIRALNAEINILPSTIVHGSSLFTRGETQALVVSALGSASDSQIIDGVTEISRKETFMLHYNFHGFAVGEMGSKSVGRREIGHGNLATRALRPVLPSHEEFPYTIRVVSEITESNGSSSMATVCGSTLSLLSTGVPLKRSVAGIAMGLIKEQGEHIILTDIIADEDHWGDMDFKVARTDRGITALQMDIKIDGLSVDIMKEALDQAKGACEKILKVIDAAIDRPSTLGANIPRVDTMTIPVKKIAELIGKSGSTIKSLCETTGTEINVDPDGKVKIFAPDSEKLALAKSMISDVISDIEVGNVYEGTVTSVMPFGLLVALPGKKSGMVHISEISEQHIEDINDFAKEGDEVTVRAIGFDDRHRLKLSIRRVHNNQPSDNQGGGRRFNKSKSNHYNR